MPAMNLTRPIVCLMGPTATGKTALAIALTQRYPFEIISVDSAMVYQDMNIGTAKPTTTEQAAAPHWLIDICTPDDPYSAGRFIKDALVAIANIQARNKIPLLVGGTMLYFHALQQGVASLPAADQRIRQRIHSEAQQKGWPEMHRILQTIDPAIAKQLHPNDAQRIQRALEVFEITGQTMTELQSTQANPPLAYPCINLVLETRNRQHLHQRIEQRFMSMLQQGFINEVEQLKKRSNIHAKLPAIRMVGYRQAWAYLDGEYDKETMQAKAIIATRQLAKRQLTWLRRWQNVYRYTYETSNFQDQICWQLEKEGLLEYYH